MVEISADILEHYFVASCVRMPVRSLVGRRRPKRDMGPRSLKFNDGFSFPSGHAATIVHLASVLSYHIDSKPFQVAAYSIAGTVFLQRITSDYHWPSDVCIGAVYGWVVSQELLKRKAYRKMKVVPVMSESGRGGGMILSFRL